MKCHYPQTTITRTSEEFSINANLYHYENFKSDAQIQFIMVCFPAATTTAAAAEAAAKKFFLLQSIQICSGAQPASYSVSTIGTLPGSKEASKIIFRCMLDRELCVNDKWIKPAQSCVMVAEADINKDFNKL